LGKEIIPVLLAGKGDLCCLYLMSLRVLPTVICRRSWIRGSGVCHGKEKRRNPHDFDNFAALKPPIS